jgi:hypothetical protein
VASDQGSDLSGIAPEEAADYRFFRQKVIGTNIHDRTLLATDYLNHFNEVIMIIELIPDAPECLDDARLWAPKSYREHFLGSGFKDKELAVAAYEHAPARYRAPFDAVIVALDDLIFRSLGEIEAVKDGGDERLRHVCSTASLMLQGLVEKASAIIHGEEAVLAQSEIDVIVDGPAKGSAKV